MTSLDPNPRPQSAPVVDRERLEDVMVPSTFIKPDLLNEVRVVIEYCNRCRWSARATWVQTELLATFSATGESADKMDESPSTLSAVTIIPRSNPETAGRFRVWLYKAGEAEPHLIHDRKTEGGFAEMKVIKQRIREIIDPNRGLGHSDKPGKAEIQT